MRLAKYTTLVRSICESKCDLQESVGFNSVDDVIAQSWNKVFTTNVNFFDENYRSVLCSKILKHYYMCEIGAETVGLWQLWVNTRLEEIMPYYNQLYESAKLEFDPFKDVDLQRAHEKGEEGKRVYDGETNSTQNQTVNREENNNDTDYRLYSDTPQGALTGVDNENYLTNATKNTSNREMTGEDTSNTTGNTLNNSTENNTSVEKYIESVTGKQGTQSYSKLLEEFRHTLLNIDMMVIDEFNDLFMGLW